MADAQLSAELTAKVSNFVAGFRKAGDAAKDGESKITKATAGISRAVTSTFAGVFSTAAIVGFGKAVLDVTSEFQKFGAVLSNTLGSSALADLRLKEIQDFAAVTPFGVNELTAAFVKLANSGFKPTGDQMRSLGDLAASTGKSFDQLAEAVLDAQVGEFERLKEFGIRAKDAGDSVIFTYKGVQTQVEKTSDAIRNYITNLGNAEGVSGSMAKISQTLGGQISNLGDSWDQMLLSVGKNTSGVFNSAIGVISRAINKITDYNEELELVSKYNLGSNTSEFFKQLNRAVNPFASKGPTDIEISTFNIKEANKDVRNFVSSSLAAAKTTADFGKALAELKRRSDIARESPLAKTFGDKKAIKDAYQQGINAIIDARRNFQTELGQTAGGNFGTGAKKDAKTVSDIMKELNIDLKLVGVQFSNTFGGEIEDRVKAYQKAIEDLVKIGVNPASAAITNLKKAQTGLYNGMLQDVPAIDGAAFNGLGVKPQVIKPVLKLEPVFLGLTDLQKRVQEFSENAGNTLSKGLLDAFSGVGSAIGNALAGAGSLVDNLGASLLSTLGGVLTQLGEMAIGVGIGLEAIKTALKSLNPVVAIAAGVALVALGSFVSQRANSLGNNVQGSDTVFTKPTAFANGGVIYGPTLGLMGEYAGAKNDPEVVAPLSKLKQILGDVAADGGFSTTGNNNSTVNNYNGGSNSYGGGSGGNGSVSVTPQFNIVVENRFKRGDLVTAVRMGEADLKRKT